jgi:imidazolonepropionase-like amidohydrolase
MGRAYLIRAARLIDGRGGEVAERPVIRIEDARITAVSTAGAMHALPAAELIDAADCTLMPGLIDAHVHLGAFNCTSFASARTARFEVTPQLQSFYALFHAQICFEMGFTTLRDAGRGTPRGDFAEEMCAVRDAINAGIVPGPRILVLAETMITGAHLELLTLPRAMRRPENFTADGPWPLRRKVRELIRSGADGIKTSVSGGIALGSDPNVRNMTQEELDAIVDEAHAFRKPVAAHCFHAEGLRMCVAAGVDTIEHMVYSDEDSIARVRAAGIWVVPTLLNRSEYVIAKNVELGLPRSLIATQRQIQPHCFDTFRRMRQAGVRIAMGTDIHNVPEMGCAARELELYVDNGMSPLEAISSATRDAASALGLAADLGTIEVGKIADIIAVRGNPATDITVLQDADNIALVIKEGRLYVDRMAATARLVRHAEPGQWKIIDRE